MPSPLVDWSFLLSNAIQSVLSVLPGSPEFMPYALYVSPEGVTDILVHQAAGPEGTMLPHEQVAHTRKLLASMASAGQVVAAAIISRIRRKEPLPDGTVDGVMVEIEYAGIGAVALGFYLRWPDGHPRLGDPFCVDRPMQIFRPANPA